VKPESDPDVQLMLAVQRDDAAAFEALFRKYIRKVVGYASSIVGSRARAEELAQDAFVRLYVARRRYRPRARFATWLYRIVTNICLSEVRRPEYRRLSRRDDVRESPGEVERGGPIRDGEEALLVRERVDETRRALAQLPSQQRAALWLARVEGLSYAEVARSLGCSGAAVKSLIHRATVALRSNLRSGEGAE